MLRRFAAITCYAVAIACFSAASAQAQAPMGQQGKAFGAAWGGQNTAGNMDRFYHYPYVTYPHNYWGNEYYRSADSMYYRYPPEMRVPVYNKAWRNYYPSPRRYHWGHQFLTDVF